MRRSVNIIFSCAFYEKRRNLLFAMPIMFLLMAYLSTSCIDPIAFEAEETTGKVVIFGNFTDQEKDHNVVIRRTGKFGKAEIAMQGAFVELINEKGKRAQFYETGEGIYTMPKGLMNGEQGEAYKLLVTLPNSSSYESSWQLMPEKTQIEGAHFNIDFRKTLSESNYLIQQFYIDIFIDTPLKTSRGNKSFLRWDVDETFSLMDFNCGPFDNAEVCYYRVPAEFGELKIFSAVDDTQPQLQNYLVYSRSPAPYIEFNELHYFIVTQYSLSESTYEFWEKINIVSNPTGSIFDKIPAGVPGNISQVNGDSEVLGYFEVASVSTARTSTTWQDLNANLQIRKACNPYISYYVQPDYCCYCFVLPNTIPKPDYWGER